MQNFTFAGVGNRLVAQIIDGLILGFAISLIIIPIFGIGIFTGSMNKFDEGAVAAIVGLALIPIILISIAAPILYEAFMLSSARQATLGKMVMKIKVVDEQGLPQFWFCPWTVVNQVCNLQSLYLAMAMAVI